MNAKYYTLTDVAQHVGKAKHKLQYLLAQGFLGETPRFNNQRMFTMEDIKKIREHYRQHDLAWEEKKKQKLLDRRKETGQG
jgi:DNA-binding transcriptional MerR regulator